MRLISLRAISSTFESHFHVLRRSASPRVIFLCRIDTFFFLISASAWMFHGLNTPLLYRENAFSIGSSWTSNDASSILFTISERDTPAFRVSTYLFPSRRSGRRTFPNARRHSPNFFLLPPHFSFPLCFCIAVSLSLLIHEEAVPLTSFVTPWKRVVTLHGRTKGALSKTCAFALRLRGSTWSRFKWLLANFPLPLRQHFGPRFNSQQDLVVTKCR